MSSPGFAWPPQLTALLSRELDNWNAFGCAVSEDLLLSQARLIASLGLRDLGYEYVVLDDCWSNGRDPSANYSLSPDLTKFPRGVSLFSFLSAIPL